MKCEICGIKEAVLFVQQITFNKTKEMHICLDCAKLHGLSGNFEIPINNLFSELLNDSGTTVKQQKAACPVCGFQLEDLQKKHRLGCPECYTFFKSEVFSLLKKSGIEGTYHGSMPKRLANFRSVLTDRMIFQEKLDKAVAEEDYEKAAFYRDKLKALHTGSDISFFDDEAEDE